MRFNDEMGKDDNLTTSDLEQERRERFGRLPARVLPSDTAETVDTRTVQDRPSDAMSPVQVAAITGGG